MYTARKRCGPGSSVGIETELRAGRSGIEYRWGRDFPPLQAGPGAHPALRKSIEKKKFIFHWNLTRITGTLRAYRYTFLIISRWIFRGMRNVSDRSCRENENTHFVFCDFFSENLVVCEIMWKQYCRAGQNTDGNMAYCVLDNEGYK